MTENYFQLFNLPPSFDIDNAALSEQYRELQRVVHPDKYVSAPEHERLLAAQQAAEINQAFQTLKAPLKRGEYLLQLEGIELNSNQTETDPVLLMEQMELREELETVSSASDPVMALDSFLSQLDNQIKALYQNLSLAFAQTNHQQAFAELRKLQFFQKAKEDALTLEEKL